MAEGVSRQLQQMISFIEFEAQTKKQEIESNAEQECEREKAAIIDRERKRLEADYANRVKQAEVKKRILYSQELSAARLRLLKTEDQHIQQLLDGVRERLRAFTQSDAYPALLEQLVLQAVTKLEDTTVTVQCVERDAPLVRRALEAVRAKAPDVRATLDETFFLDDRAIGGVVVASLGDRIVCANTLEHRLAEAHVAALPEIRARLFPSLKSQRQRN